MHNYPIMRSISKEKNSFAINLQAKAIKQIIFKVKDDMRVSYLARQKKWF